MILTIKIVSKYREEIEIQISKKHTTIDVHVAEEPLRIITGGVPEIKGEMQLERRAYCMERLEHLREFLCMNREGIVACTVALLLRLQVLTLILVCYLCTVRCVWSRYYRHHYSGD